MKPGFAAAVAIVGWCAFILAPHSLHAGEARDWSAHPAIVQVQTDQDIYALGDIHGDYEKLTQLLAGTKLIADVPEDPSDVQWAAGKSTLVIVGDFIDKYDRSLDVIACLRALQHDAEKKGGRVIITMGNHEAEFLAGGGKKKKAVSIVDKIAETDGKGKKSPTLDSELKAAGIAATDVAEGKDAQGIGQFLRNLPIAAKVNDWFFCHAGNTHGAMLESLSESLMKGIDADGFGATVLSDPDSILQARMHPHPWWEAKDASMGEQELRANLEALDCRRLVFGHQPGPVTFADGTQRAADQIFTKFDGLVFLIDTGMSRGADGARGAVLQIHVDNGRTKSLFADGTSTTLWNGVTSR